jgi:hypothetical protein
LGKRLCGANERQDGGKGDQAPAIDFEHTEVPSNRVAAERRKLLHGAVRASGAASFADCCPPLVECRSRVML